ncbi:MAG: hypothetical protein VX498_07570, partial [Myxococcota bacterium]|nr:hypothetical protein [Myxococcota bacterium]
TEQPPTSEDPAARQETVAPSVDPMMVAIDAQAANQKFCADIYNAKVSRSSAALANVNDALVKVDKAYAESNAGYLLYWRGALRQCLNISDRAKEDLELFVEKEGNNVMFAALVRDAQKRLRRLGAAVKSTGGASADLVRSSRVLDLRLDVAGGSGVLGLLCTDPLEGDNGRQTVNSACTPSGGAGQVQAALAPLVVDIGVDGYFSDKVGLAGRVRAGVLVPMDFPNDRAPGPSLEVSVGPTFRLLNPAANGQLSVALRIQPQFAFALSEVHPWAGSAKYLTDMEEDHGHAFFDAGSFQLPSIGGGVRLQGEAETGPSTLVEWGVDGVYYAPSPVSFIRRTAEPSDDIPESRRVEPTGAGRFSVGGRIGVLRTVGDKALAIGPYVDLRLNQSSLSFPDNPAHCWDVGLVGHEDFPQNLDCSSAGDGGYRKIFSTSHLHFLARVGITIRLMKKRK